MANSWRPMDDGFNLETPSKIRENRTEFYVNEGMHARERVRLPGRRTFTFSDRSVLFLQTWLLPHKHVAISSPVFSVRSAVSAVAVVHRTLDTRSTHKRSHTKPMHHLVNRQREHQRSTKMPKENAKFSYSDLANEIRCREPKENVTAYSCLSASPNTTEIR